jgi:hypothetical protein
VPIGQWQFARRTFFLITIRISKIAQAAPSVQSVQILICRRAFNVLMRNCPKRDQLREIGRGAINLELQKTSGALVPRSPLSIHKKARENVIE